MVLGWIFWGWKFLSTKNFSPRAEERRNNTMMGLMTQFRELIAKKKGPEKVVNCPVLEKQIDLDCGNVKVFPLQPAGGVIK